MGSHVYRAALRQRFLRHFLDASCNLVAQSYYSAAPRTSLRHWAETSNLALTGRSAQTSSRPSRSACTALLSSNSGIWHHTAGYLDQDWNLLNTRRLFGTIHHNDGQQDRNADIIANLQRRSQRAENLEEAQRLHSMYEWPVRDTFLLLCITFSIAFNPPSGLSPCSILCPSQTYSLPQNH
jgi:hypothetical protein